MFDFLNLKPTDAIEHGGIFTEFATQRRKNGCRSEGKLEEDSLDLSDNDDLQINIFERPEIHQNNNFQQEYSQCCGETDIDKDIGMDSTIDGVS